MENLKNKSTFDIPGIELLTSHGIEDTWKKVSYDSTDDKPGIERYMGMLASELGLYPDGYLKKALVGRIILGRDLAFNGEYRAAVPDPYRRTLFLSINGSYGESRKSYLVHVLHHELHHMAEYAVWKDMYFNWSEWNRLNPEGFSYGRGGTGSYRNNEMDYYTVTHPLNGFMNLYSMTGGEEDRSELMAFLMSAMDRHKLLKYYPGDTILRRKIDFISAFVNNIAGVRFVDIGQYL
jgi:hypothetical protein